MANNKLFSKLAAGGGHKKEHAAAVKMLFGLSGEFQASDQGIVEHLGTPYEGSFPRYPCFSRPLSRKAFLFGYRVFYWPLVPKIIPKF